MDTQWYLNAMKPEFLSKMELINWKAGQWMQYTGYTVDQWNYLHLHFKSSTYGIGFDTSFKLFLHDQDEDFYLNFNEVYDFFRDAKYKEFGDRIY